MHNIYYTEILKNVPERTFYKTSFNVVLQDFISLLLTIQCVIKMQLLIINSYSVYYTVQTNSFYEDYVFFLVNIFYSTHYCDLLLFLVYCLNTLL